MRTLVHFAIMLKINSKPVLSLIYTHNIATTQVEDSTDVHVCQIIQLFSYSKSTTTSIIIVSHMYTHIMCILYCTHISVTVLKKQQLKLCKLQQTGYVHELSV